MTQQGTRRRRHTQAATGKVVVAAGTWFVLRNIVVEAFHIVEHRAVVELGQHKHFDCTLGQHRHLGYKTVAGNLVGLRILNHLKKVGRERERERMRERTPGLSID